MRLLVLAAALLSAPVLAQATAQGDVAAILAAAGPGTRFGLMVVDDGGRTIAEVNPDERFIPASNTKMFTTAAAYATLDMQAPAGTGASVRLEPDGRGAPGVVLVGGGDARLSSAPDCAADCLSTLADAVAARTRIVGDVAGDDSAFPDQRWSPGMSWNNIPTRSGTGVSALTLDNNEAVLTVTPGAAGTMPAVASDGYYTVDNRVLTVAGAKNALSYDRAPNSRVVRLTGTIAAGAEPQRLRMGIDDPAYHAAWRFAQLLRARGVRVTGAITARHRPLTPADDPAMREGAPAARPPAEPALATLTPGPLAADVVTINKTSQNLHAELLLRLVGARDGSGSIADGQAQVGAMLARAGVPRWAYDFSDGSGMSSYNRISPRGAVTFLRWVAAQPWGAEWRASLPVGGQDGTLARAFRGTALDGRIFAKTGTLNATNALAGYLVGASGRTLTFAFYANDVPQDAGAAAVMYKALLKVAAAN
ncbi:D-alanyl-D-alanine carboxypeptidase/D-alanyl-D-alanine-endopeptidase [Sphingomonas aracearum]|uniref:D-alanyl-D-alanine carboxypeptidase/D-alanyl-D-alanine-endopeptidase n=2 Tax=Sphingomonas aracearum TaxID=2283317 RepID=A0A369VXG6_9SPHN|nr:D-alanyl-D-alanine carboxypeptidase/D-alanyl-D-alanine-endopeptidase [Sphingomonas aracearum]